MKPHLLSHVRRTMPAALCTAALAGLAACGTFDTTPRYRGTVAVAQEANVMGCQKLGEVRGSSSLTGLFAPKGTDNIKQSLLGQADAMGATHIVWEEASALNDSTSLSGKAYRCPADTK